VNENRPPEHQVAGAHVVVVEEQLSFTLEQLGLACECDVRVIERLVEHDVLSPQGGSPDAWRFAGSSLARARRALRLRAALDLDGPGLALAMDLLDEIDRLRAQVAALSSSGVGAPR